MDEAVHSRFGNWLASISSTSSSRAPASRSWPICGAGWRDLDCTCQSPPTSPLRRAHDPYQVAERGGRGHRRSQGATARRGTSLLCRLPSRIGLPVVVSSALETSIGIRAGLALAAALPELPYACGLNTVALLADDLAMEPLIAVDGVIKVGDLAVDEAALDKHRPDDEVQRFWQARLVQTRELAGG